MSDADRLAYVVERVRARIEDELGISYREINRRHGPSPITLSNFLEHQHWIKRRDRRAGLCLAIGWEADGLDRLMRGEEPIEVKDGDGEEQIARLAAIQAAQTRAIRALDGRVAALEEGIRSELRGIADALDALRSEQPPS